MLKEFKEFAVKGNVLDLAVGVVVGGAFGKIVTSLVNDIIMPLVGVLLGGINFSSLSYPLGTKGDTPNLLKYGQFIQSIADFLIISFSIFLFIKLINSFKKKEEEKEEAIEEAKEAAPSREELLLTEIRDLLKNK